MVTVGDRDAVSQIERTKGDNNMKESKLPKRFWLIIAVAMILVSMIGSNLVQSDGGKVKIHKVNLVVADGAELSPEITIFLSVIRRCTAWQPAQPANAGHEYGGISAPWLYRNLRRRFWAWQFYAKRLRRPIYELCQYALSAGIRLQQPGSH